ncbi:MAG: family NAD(P)-dependent oxidoreductase [Microbacterium sp.]|jgi:NAD(P)-dependent dehydrogenase (short-subunit alcohol dehydrogenase family)|uniref:SDR family NAD(P)-dependent oxidoreductase n=1 Tax=Microbacterium sp. TaxID=51671 RepID=UPI0026266BC3|nr:SDR family NAD(P)-dependent oxidoreductase [Microbacterium sp.]MDF2561554.1 family NAD(P)-dependent oxidoreductase [Microbacterium sp.]
MMVASRAGDRGTVVLTGATSGIGLATARRLAATTDRLIVQGPETRSSVDATLRLIRDSGSAELTYVECDFTNLRAVARAADTIAQFGPIDALVNNAGIPGAASRRTTPDGHERTLQVNYLAMVLLTERLRPGLQYGARIVNLASATHTMAQLTLDDIELTREYSAVRAYARSKLAIVMYTRWMARRAGSGATAVSIQPGVINTELLGAMFGSIGGSVEIGAQSILTALSAPATSGEYFDEGQQAVPSPEARDDDLGDKLMRWTFSTLRDFV